MARIEQSIDVDVPVQAAYIQLTEFEEYPSFMEGVEQVRLLDDSHVRWHAREGDTDRQGDVEITELVPDCSIAWRLADGARHAGRVKLQPLDDDRTRIVLSVECEPDAEGVTARRIGGDLARFKKFIERLPDRAATAGTGDIPAGEQMEDTGQRTGSAEHPQGTSSRTIFRPPWLPNLLQAWEAPLMTVRKVSEEMDEMAQRYIRRPLYGSRARQRGIGPGWTPPIEITRHNDQFIVCAELPGVRREDVHIEIKRAKLTIEGDRHAQPASGAPPAFRRSERSYGHFCRVIALPEDADEDAVSASMHEGLLEIKVPLGKDGQTAKRVDIG